MSNVNPSFDSTRRFSNRVDHYVKYRPGYPDAVIEVLKQEASMAPSAKIADVGSGTGISAELFLRHGHTVYGVEPNAEMRMAAEVFLRTFPQFHSVAGTAENTTLASGSVDVVVAAQAFHWFDPATAQAEFVRILKPDGVAVLMWNSRQQSADGFQQAYEALLAEFGTDYRLVDHKNITMASLGKFFGTFQRHVLYNEQTLDVEGFKGRLWSSSYLPAPEDPRHGPMMEEAERVFSRFNEDGRVRIKYDTEVYVGTMPPRG